uniref:Uncharacterized protein n=1 Tax=Arundo donax TaxID=35708 RepID=A0A0A9CAA5_ARUDO
MVVDASILCLRWRVVSQ